MTYALARIAAPAHPAAGAADPARPRMERRLAFSHARLERDHVVRVSGDVDLANAPRLQAALGRARTLPGTLILDLCEAGSLDEDGTLLLVNAVRRLVRSGRAVSIACPPGELRDRLERRGLLRHVEVLDGRDELARAFGEPAVPTDRVEPSAPARRPRMTERPETPWRRGALLAEATLETERRHGEIGLSLAEVARAIATSERQLQRVFAELGGTSFRDELTAVRMQHAAELLYARGLPVGSIARRVGYRQAAQFAKAFRRHHGQSPTAFRDAAAARPG
jgi:AraC family transcriptional regulator, regulatory protein of adaptative response / methylphosphotriester-DNA alkyltransferase methyltransferase